jgi:hypothetical protein
VLCFVEIPFADAAGDESVRQAFGRRKRALLAEGERRATGLFAKLVRKVLPLLMQRLQATVTDAKIICQFSSGMHMQLTLDRASLAPLTSATAVQRDLVRELAVAGLRVVVDGLPVFEVEECSAKLVYRAGELEIDVRLASGVSVSMSDVIADQAAFFRRKADLWECAYQFGRPVEKVQNTARAWWRYAVRVLMRNNGALKGYDENMSTLRSCIEYYDMHVARLRKGGPINARDRDRCERLEDVLSVETVLLLRGKARKAVRADQAARYAAEDWLGWIAGSNLARSTSARDEAANEIRQAISTLEDAEESDEKFNSALSAVGLAPARAMTLRSIAFSADVTRVSFQFISSEDDLKLDVIARAPSLSMHSDANLASLDMEGSIEDLVVRNADVVYLQLKEEGLLPSGSTESRSRATVANAASASVSAPPPHTPKLVRANWRRTADFLQNVFAVRVGMVALHVDIAQLSPAIQIASKLLSAPPLSDDSGSCSRLRGVRERSAALSQSRATARVRSAPRSYQSAGRGDVESKNGTVAWPRVELDCASLQVLFSSGLARVDSAGSLRRGALVSLSNITWEMAPSMHSGEHMQRICLDMSLRTCVIANDTLRPSGTSSQTSDEVITDDAGFIRLISMGDPCVRIDSGRLMRDGTNWHLEFKDVSVVAWDTEMLQLMRLLNLLDEEMASEMSFCAPSWFAAVPFPGVACVESVLWRAESESDGRALALPVTDDFANEADRSISVTFALSTLHCVFATGDVCAGAVLTVTVHDLIFGFDGHKESLSLGSLSVASPSALCACELKNLPAQDTALAVWRAWDEEDLDKGTRHSVWNIQLAQWDARVDLGDLLPLFRFFNQLALAVEDMGPPKAFSSERGVSNAAPRTVSHRFVFSVRRISVHLVPDVKNLGDVNPTIILSFAGADCRTTAALVATIADIVGGAIGTQG